MRAETFAGFEHKVSDICGYSLLSHGECAQYLCPAFPTRGVIGDAKCFAFDVMQDAVHGKHFWEGDEGLRDSQEADTYMCHDHTSIHQEHQQLL